jgi:large subunit ribosomal protein L6
MSRLGKLPIILAPSTQVTQTGDLLNFKGPKGQLSLKLPANMGMKIENNELFITPHDKAVKNSSAVWGLTWSLVKNAVQGVTIGFVKKLEINGVGYRAAVSGSQLNMSLGFSHPIEFKLPAGITASVAANVITLEGIDNCLLGEVAAKIRKIRKPEPYKGKGIKYSDEIIRRKAGKSATKGK